MITYSHEIPMSFVLYYKIVFFFKERLFWYFMFFSCTFVLIYFLNWKAKPYLLFEVRPGRRRGFQWCENTITRWPTISYWFSTSMDIRDKKTLTSSLSYNLLEEHIIYCVDAPVLLGVYPLANVAESSVVEENTLDRYCVLVWR